MAIDKIHGVSSDNKLHNAGAASRVSGNEDETSVFNANQPARETSLREDEEISFVLESELYESETSAPDAAQDDTIPSTQQGTVYDTVQTALNEIQYLNSKYNLNLNIEDPGKITDEQIALLEKIKFIDSMPDYTEQMVELFNGQGIVDFGYDALKTVFPGLTKEEIEELSKKDDFKKQLLISSLVNGGKLTIGNSSSDTTAADGTISQETILSFVKDAMSCMDSYDELIEYAVKNLGLSQEKANELLTNVRSQIEKDKEVPWYAYAAGTAIARAAASQNTDWDKILLEKLSEELINNAVIDSNELSFENLYSLLTGVKYNQEAIQELNSMAPVYNSALETAQNAILTQSELENATPQEAFEYFQKLADERDDGKTAAQLFNEYYANLFEYANSIEPNPLLTAADFESGLRLSSITIDDNGVITETFEIANEEKYKEEQELYGNEFYYYDEKTGVVSRTYSVYYSENEDTLYEAPLDTRAFLNLNAAISQNNLYLKLEKDNFNAQFGEMFTDEEGNSVDFDMFTYIMAAYPEMQQEAMGINVFENKLSEYANDMATYKSELAGDISKAGFVLSWIPGCQALGIISLIGAYSDNVLDLVNILTSNDKNKGEKLAQLAGSTAFELLGTFAGFKINAFAHQMGGRAAAMYFRNANNPIASLTRGVQTAAEYGTDVLASMGWDVMTYILQNGKLPEGDEFRNIALQNLLFNSGDLRGGMALFRAMNDPNAEIDIGNGRTIKYNEDGSIVYTEYDYTRYLSADSSTTVTADATGARTVWIRTDKGDVVYRTDESGNARYVTSNGTEVTVPEATIHILANNGIDVDSALQFKHDVLDATYYVNQDDNVSCVAAGGLSAIYGHYGIEQALLNKFVTVNAEEGEYKITLFGKEVTVKLDGETNPLELVYKAYLESVPDGFSGDFAMRFIADLLGSDGDRVIATLNGESIFAIKAYVDEGNTALILNATEDFDGLVAGHAYSLLSIDDGGVITLRDTNGDIIKLEPKQYEGKVQVEGMSYGQFGEYNDGTPPRQLAGVSGTEETSNQPQQIDQTRLLKLLNNSDDIEYGSIESGIIYFKDGSTAEIADIIDAGKTYGKKWTIEHSDGSTEVLYLNNDGTLATVTKIGNTTEIKFNDGTRMTIDDYGHGSQKVSIKPPEKVVYYNGDTSIVVNEIIENGIKQTGYTITSPKPDKDGDICIVEIRPSALSGFPNDARLLQKFLEAAKKGKCVSQGSNGLNYEGMGKLADGTKVKLYEIKIDGNARMIGYLDPTSGHFIITDYKSDHASTKVAFDEKYQRY